VESEYKAAIAKAKADRKDAYAVCDKSVTEQKLVCRKEASNAFKKAQADAKATHRKALAELKGKKTS
jgi:hypothetical protein